MSQNNQINQLTFKTVRSENHRTIICNRVWGGFVSGPLLEVNFITERISIPETVTVELTEDGSEVEKSRDHDGTILREIHFTAMFTPQTLIGVHKWLGEKINELEREGILQRVED